MRKFDYVEDYLQVIAGHIDPVTGQKTSHFYWEFKPIINLARYDVKVLESMASQVSQNQAFTAKQAALACKIILTYRRQLAGKSIDVTPIENPQWRMSLREMDYSRRLYIENDRLQLRFPFSNNLIESIRNFTKESQGSTYWNRDKRVWEISLTEYNLCWLYTWCTANEFEVDTKVTDLFTRITEVETQGYAIELYVDGDKLNITNCPNSLRNYIDNNLNGFSLDNLMTLVDLSSILGYTINSDLAQALIAEYGLRFFNLATHRELKISPDTPSSTADFNSILDYADGTERWPVVVYEPDLSGRMLGKLRARYGDAVLVAKTRDTEIPLDCRYIYAVMPIQNINHIPLLISSAGMVFGGDKQLMIQRAEKIVYCAQDVYNKHNSKGKNICKLS